MKRRKFLATLAKTLIAGLALTKIAPANLFNRKQRLIGRKATILVQSSDDDSSWIDLDQDTVEFDPNQTFELTGLPDVELTITGTFAPNKKAGA
jgi:hypothetical protein